LTSLWSYLRGRLGLIETILSIGLADSARLFFRRAARREGYVALHRHQLVARAGDSDIGVFRQVFVDRQYDPGAQRKQQLMAFMQSVTAAGDTPVIIDGGANVGYSSVFFAKEYPLATIIAVEPDPSSFEGLRLNTGSLENVRPVLAAIWKHDRGVNLTSVDQPSWARQVADAGTTASRTVEDLVATVPRGRLVLLKLDVEGAEIEIISHSAEAIRGCPCVMIEPHDWIWPGKNSLAPLFGVLAGRRIDTVITGENLMFFDTGMLGGP